MKHRPQKIRLIIGIASILISILLVWALSDLLGGMVLLVLSVGGGIFIWLTPELMSGE